ncbi:2023_t:CDS:2, partial [Ambispora leptoticha]
HSSGGLTDDSSNLRRSLAVSSRFASFSGDSSSNLHCSLALFW